MLVLVAMLLTRQLLQNKQLLPLEKTATANAREYRQVLQPYVEGTVRAYRAGLWVFVQPRRSDYLQRLRFLPWEKCRRQRPRSKKPGHPAGKLDGHPGHPSVSLPHYPLRGPGTGMGYFTIYDRYQVDALMAYLNEKYQVSARPGDIPHPIAPPVLAQAEATYAKTCAGCHGPDGGALPCPGDFNPRPRT